MPKTPKRKLPFDPLSLKGLTVSGLNVSRARPSKTYVPMGQRQPTASMINRELAEHKWMSYRTATRVVADHLRKKKGK